jgi:hypothetical protein
MSERQIPSFDAANGQLWVCAHESIEKRLAETPLEDYVGKAENGQNPEYRFGVCEDHIPYEGLLNIPPHTEAERYAQLLVPIEAQDMGQLTSDFPQTIEQ